MKTINTTSFWRNITKVWTIVFFAAIIYDFLTANSLETTELLLPIAVIYDAVLAVYSAEKEFKRWHDCHRTIHPGELYVILWTILIFGLLGLSVVVHHPYHIPPEVSASYIVVIGILAITRESKHFYKRMQCDIEEDAEFIKNVTTAVKDSVRQKSRKS
jgi:uncharacterized membrane protein YhaH (DUF805 family)